MAQHVATLEILTVICLLERDVFRKRFGVVAHMQTRREDGRSTSPKRRGAIVPDPAGAKLDQLLVRQRLAGTWVAPAHVPGIFDKHRTHVLTHDGAIEHCLVEFSELRFDVKWHVHAGRQLDGAIIGGLDPTLPRQRVDDQVLRSIGINGAQAQRDHEFRRLVTDLERP